MERTTLEIIAPTVEDAIAQGLGQLGLGRDLVDVEVLDAGSKGFLGIGGRQVRVRLTVKPAQTSPEPDSAPQTDSSPAQVPATQPAETSIKEDSLLQFARETVETLVTKMKLDAKVTTRYEKSGDAEDEDSILVDIRGDDLSVLIGRRSETLNALQYITGLIVSKEAGKWVQVTVDVEGYRNRRERQLRQLARRMAEQVIRTNKRQMLEPMSSAERRIIHLELRNHPQVETLSVGEEPNRKVTIVPK